MTIKCKCTEKLKIAITLPEFDLNSEQTEMCPKCESIWENRTKIGQFKTIKEKDHRYFSGENGLIILF